ncbi:MAG: protein kinase [Cyanobacteria bacterium]|nr:protein kinase [Cyanobacteriota bacterium]
MGDKPPGNYKTERIEERIQLKVCEPLDAVQDKEDVQSPSESAIAETSASEASTEANLDADVTVGEKSVLNEPEKLFDCHSADSKSRAGIFVLEDDLLSPGFDEIERMLATNRCLSVEPESFPLERYQPLVLLSKHESAVSYLAIDRLMQTRVKVECFRESLSPDGATLFEQGIKRARRLRNDNVVTVCDFGTTQSGEPYVVSEYDRFVSLEDYLSRVGALEVKNGIDLFVQLCEAMTYLEDKDVSTDGISTAAILLSKRVDGSTCVKIDTTRLLHSALQKCRAENSLTNGDTPLKPDAIVCIGLILFEALTAVSPYHMRRKTDSKNDQPFPSLAQTLPGRAFRRETEELVARCLSREPDRRFDNFQKIKHELLALNEVICYSGDSDVEQVGGKPKSTAKHRKAIAFVCMFAMLVFAAGMVHVSKLRILDYRLQKMPQLNFGVEMFGPFMLVDALQSDPYEHDRSIDIEGKRVTRKMMQDIVNRCVHPRDDRFDDLNGLSKRDNLTQPKTENVLSEVRFTKCTFDPDALDPLNKLTRLETIQFQLCGELKPEVIRRLVSSKSVRKSLNRVTIYSTYLDSKALRELGKLSHLNLTVNDPRIKDRDFEGIRGSHLTRLNIYGTSVTDSGIKILLDKRYEMLDTLEFRSKQVSKQTVLELKAQYPDCHIGIEGSSVYSDVDSPVVTGPNDVFTEEIGTTGNHD